MTTISEYADEWAAVEETDSHKSRKLLEKGGHRHIFGHSGINVQKCVGGSFFFNLDFGQKIQEKGN